VKSDPTPRGHFSGKNNGMNDRAVDFEKGDGLVPAIVQDADTGRVLMMGYMNQESLTHTRQTGMVTFFSRSRSKLWTKGETSGNYLELVDIAVDCDGDTLLVKARPRGPTCHTGNESCFDLEPDRGWRTLSEAVGGLARDIELQKGAFFDASRGNAPLDENIKRAAGELKQRIKELTIASEQGDREAMVQETARLIYHAILLIANLDIPPEPLARRLWKSRK